MSMRKVEFEPVLLGREADIYDKIINLSLEI